MAKIDTPDPKKSKDKKTKKWWKNPLIFAGGLALLILAPIFALSIKNHNSLMTLVTSLKGDITSQNEEMISLKGEVTSLKGEVISLTEEVTSLAGEVTSLKGGVTTLKGDMTSQKKDEKFTKETEMCPEGWHKMNSKCYLSPGKRMDFSQAKDLCHKKGATMFEPKDQHINDMVNDFAKTKFGWGSKYMNAYWIGIVRIPGSDKWKWVKDNSPVSWYNWNKAWLQPNGYGDCAGASTYHHPKWWDISCANRNFVICEKSV